MKIVNILSKSLNKTSLGILLYLCGMVFTVLLNVFLKKAIKVYSIPTWETLFIRQSIIVIFLLPLIIKSKFKFFKKEQWKPNVFRNLLFTFSTFLLYFGLSQVPVNEATSITFLVPIIGSILAIKFLGEKSSKSIWIALILSVCGVCVIKQPGFDNNSANIGYIALLLCALIRGYIVILNKKLATKFDTNTILYYTHIVMLFISFFFVLLSYYQGTFVIPCMTAILYISFASLLFFLEYWFIFKAYKLCKVVVLQPIEFSRIIMAMILGYLILDEAISMRQCVGAGIIIAGFCVMLFGKNIISKK